MDDFNTGKHTDVNGTAHTCAADAAFTEREKTLLLQEVQQAVYDKFVSMRRLIGEPVTFNDIEDEYCARKPTKRKGYPDHLVEQVEIWFHKNTNAVNEFDKLFFVDNHAEDCCRWYINERAVPPDVRERRRNARPVPIDPERQKRPKPTYGLIRGDRYQ